MQQFINEDDRYSGFLVSGQQQEELKVSATFRALEAWDQKWRRMESKKRNNGTTL